MSEKRGPGRPPNSSNKKSLNRDGILSEPSTTEEIPPLQRVMELYYDNPMIIKKIFGLYKHMKSQNISIFFMTDRVVFLSTNFGGCNYIHSEILCDRVNGYYVEEPFTIGLDCNKIQSVINKINKDYQSITFWCNREEKEVKLNITLYQDKLDNEITSKVILEKPQITDLSKIDEQIAQENTYPISFVLSALDFKKKITDANNLGPIIRIEKNGDDPLTFITEHNSNNGTDTDVFKNDDKISLCSKISSDELFSTSVYLSTLKPLAGALISDELKISVDKYHSIIFTAYMERTVENKNIQLDTETCVVRVLNPVIDYRKK